MLFMGKLLLPLYLIAFSVLADKPLFNKKEQKELNYLASRAYIADQQREKLGKMAELKMKVALELYVRQDKAKRKNFSRPGLWEREEKRENYKAMEKWLEEISPVTNERNPVPQKVPVKEKK